MLFVTVEKIILHILQQRQQSSSHSTTLEPINTYTQLHTGQFSLLNHLQSSDRKRTNSENPLSKTDSKPFSRQLSKRNLFKQTHTHTHTHTHNAFPNPSTHNVAHHLPWNGRTTPIRPQPHNHVTPCMARSRPWPKICQDKYCVSLLPLTHSPPLHKLLFWMKNTWLTILPIVTSPSTLLCSAGRSRPRGGLTEACDSLRPKKKGRKSQREKG
jgi:hypothetical protein